MLSQLWLNSSPRNVFKSAYKYSALLLLPLLFNPLNSAAALRAGSLDPTFGTGGIVTTPIGSSSGANTVLVQPDGKIIAAGYALAAQSYDFALRRYLPNGAIDTGFGDNGVVLTDMSIVSTDPTGDTILSVALQADGKIVAVGYAAVNQVDPISPYSAYAIARYNPNGSLDTTFDGDGKIVMQRLFNSAIGVEIQADGKIVFTGSKGRCADCSNRLTIETFRLNQDGTLDGTFGDAGKATTTIQGDLTARAMRLQPDGKIVIGGFGHDGSAPGFAVARLNTNGSLDLSFNGSGIALYPSFSNTNPVTNIALQPDGKIIAGRGIGATVNEDFEITRLNPNGAFDNTFGTNGSGRVITAPSSFSDILGEVVVQPDGKIIAAGENDRFQPTFAHIGAILVRYNPNGTLDSSFGNGGIVATPDRYISDAALQSDGKLVTVGRHFTVMRYLTTVARDFDYDGDGKADISVFRPPVGDWYISRSSNGAFSGTNFGSTGDLIAPADFDGDGKTDISVFRPSTGSWYRLNSSNNSFTAAQFGANGDLPVPGDFDGDGKADISVYRPSAGSWYRINSSNNQFIAAQFGISEDKPLIGDFDGDGKSDLAVFRPSNGTWYRINSGSDTFSAHQFGIAEDKPTAADYDSDGKTDLAVFRPSNGYWYRLNSGNNSFSAHQFGITEDKPAPADFDGDGKTDLTVFRPSSGTWYLLRSTAGFTGVQFGTSGDVPTPNAFIR